MNCFISYDSEWGNIHFDGLTSVYPCITNIFPNYNQQDATFLDLFISTDALHVSDGSSTHHEEHKTVHTASGIVNQYWCYRGYDGTAFHLIHDSSQQQYWLTIPEAVCTFLCSWWWAEEPPETCRASVEINKSRNAASCLLSFGNIFILKLGVIWWIWI